MSKNLDQVYTANPITVNANTDLMYFMQSPYTVGTDAGMTYANFKAQFGNPYTPAALTKTDDTNVTLTLAGTPGTALLHAASITAGWTGTLSVTRGGTGLASTAPYALFTGGTTGTGALQQVASPGTTGQVLTSSGAGALPVWATTTPGVTSTQVQQAAFNIGVDSGTADAYAVTLNPVVTTLTDGLSVYFTPTNNNTTSTPTLSVNGLTPVVISSPNTANPVSPGDLSTLQIAYCVYSSASNSFLLMTPAVSNTTGLTKHVITANQQLVANSINIISGTGLITVSMPSIVTEGDVVQIIGFSAGGWTVSVPSGDQYFIGNIGAPTSISSTYKTDCITLVFAGMITGAGFHPAWVVTVDQGTVDAN